MDTQLETPFAVLNALHALQQRLAFESPQWQAGWMRSVDAARIVWNRLTHDELLQTAGELEKLSCLVAERYALSRDEALSQVQDFLSQCGTWS